MPVPTRLIMALEQRMKDFLESRTAKEIRPVALAMTNGIQEDVKRILIQRMVWLELLSSEHISDSHLMDGCHVCQGPYRNSHGRFDGEAYRFIQMNSDLLAEIELSY